MAKQAKYEAILDELREESLKTGDIIRSDEDKRKMLDDLVGGITSVTDREENQKLYQKWDKWRRQRLGRPENETKDYPWQGASNVVPPMAMNAANGVSALLQAYFGDRKPFWSVSAWDKAHADTAKGINFLLNAMSASPQHINLGPTLGAMFGEYGLMGTQFIWVPWDTRRWYFKRKNPQTGILETVNRISKNCPIIYPIRIEDYISRPYWRDPQVAPWVGRRLWYTKMELLLREQQGVYVDVEKVIESGEDDFDENTTKDLQRFGITPAGATKAGMFAIYEMHYYMDVDGDGYPEDVIVWLHPASETILRTEFNDLGVRPIVRMPYLDIPGELYGMGTGWICETLQDEAEALHNMRVDGTHIAALQMYITKKGGGLPEHFQFRPFQAIPVDNPQDFVPIKFPDPSTWTLQGELLVKEFIDRATGLGDAMMGFENSAIRTKATASGTMFLASQNSKLFAAAAINGEDALAEVGKLLVFQCVKNKEQLLPQLKALVPKEMIPSVTEALNISIEDIPSTLHFRVTTTDLDKTEEAKKQSMLVLTQLYSSYAQQLFQLYGMVYGERVPPQMQQLGQKFIVGATTLMGDILDSFGVKDSKDMLPYVKDIEMMVEAIEMAKEQAIGGIKNGLSGRSEGMGPNGGGGGVPVGGASGPAPQEAPQEGGGGQGGIGQTPPAM